MVDIHTGTELGSKEQACSPMLIYIKYKTAPITNSLWAVDMMQLCMTQLQDMNLCTLLFVVGSQTLKSTKFVLLECLTLYDIQSCMAEYFDYPKIAPV